MSEPAPQDAPGRGLGKKLGPLSVAAWMGLGLLLGIPWWWPWVVEAWGDHAGAWYARDRAAIAIATPAVYSRERLLNDRFEQVEWLDRRLRETEAQFQQMQARPAPAPEAGARPTPEMPAARETPGFQITGRNGERVTAGGSPREAFSVMNGYRDLLRGERAREMLDDTHDIDGNTLYLLAFDTTVVARPGSQGQAVVEATLFREPGQLNRNAVGRREAEARLEALELQDLFDIYVQWLGRVRRSYEASIANAVEALSRGSGSQSGQATQDDLIPGLIPTLKVAACAERVAVELMEGGSLPAVNRLEREEGCRAVLGGGLFAHDRLRPAQTRVPVSPAVRVAATRAMRWVEDSLDELSRDAAQRQLEYVVGGVVRGAMQSFDDPSLRHINLPQILEEPARVLADPATACGPGPDRLRQAQLSHAGAEFLAAARGVFANLTRPGPPGQPRPGPNPDLSLIVNLPPVPPQRGGGPAAIYCQSDVTSLLARAQWLYALAEPWRLGEPREAASLPRGAGGRPAPQAVPRASLLRADVTCVAAAFFHTSILRPTTGDLNNYGSAAAAFFDSSLRRRSDGTCELAIEPPFAGRVDQQPAAKVQTRVRSNIVEGSAAQRGAEVTDVAQLRRVWSAGAWRTVSQEHPLRLRTRVGGAYVDLDVVEVLAGPDEAPEAGFLFFATPAADKRPLALPLNAELEVVAPRHASNAWAERQAPFAEAEGFRSFRVEDVTPFLHVALGETVHAVSPDNRLAVTLQAEGAPRAWSTFLVRASKEPGGSGGWVQLRWPELDRETIGRDRPACDTAAACTLRIDQRRSLLLALRAQLDGPGYSERAPAPLTRATTYGLTPRLRQSLERETDRSAGLAAGATHAGATVQSDNRTRRAATEAEVVGFSRPVAVRPGTAHDDRVARFGWLVMPQSVAGGSAAWVQPVQEVQLGAIISVPSWWRSALLQVCRGFTAGSRAPDIMRPEFWDHAADCHAEVLRLPGTANDVSRRLGVEVITFPFVNPPNDPTRDLAAALGGAGQEAPSQGGPPLGPASRREERNDQPTLIAEDPARPASVLIRGERLWRSTVVTLGGQRANRITVLPDMTGIIATFDCVQPPATWTALEVMQGTAPSRVFTVPLTVWTSEGRSRELSARVIVEAASTRRCPSPLGAAPTPAAPAAR